MALVVACGPEAIPSPTSPAPAPRPVGTAVQTADGSSRSFEHGLDGFTIEAGGAQPVCAPVDASRLERATGKRLVTLEPPGDYWRTPIDVGQDGACRIDTGAPTNARTILRSSDFTIASPFISFRIGGGGRPGTRVELELAQSSYSAALVERGPGTITMRRVTWETASYQGQRGRIAIIDEDGQGTGLLVDDFRESQTKLAAEPAPLWGFADLHAHPVTQLGFGGHAFFGANEGALTQALSSCQSEHGPNGLGGHAGLAMAAFEASYKGGLGHPTTGSPDFDGWPRYTTQAHQQMHVDWIRRAWQGGLRLMVAHAVNNEQLADLFNGTKPYDDMTVVERQLKAMQEMVGRHQDFMEIAPSAAKARTIIESGRLAIVLGVEVDSIGNCRRDTDCTEQQVRGWVQKLHAWGARHVFPVHLADNALGGTAIYHDGTFNLLSWYLRGDYQKVEHDGSVDFAFGFWKQDLPVYFSQVTLRKNMYGKVGFFPPYDDYKRVKPGHVNARSLTALGRAAIDEMMKLGIVIDADHMGQSTRAELYKIATERRVPIAMGHAWFRDLGYTQAETNDSLKLRHEAMKTAEEIELVRALGGVVAPITNQGDIRRAQSSGVSGECAGASTSWLQAYAYLAERMQGTGVGFGTDFNGLAEEPLPRFGPWACLGRREHSGLDDTRRRIPGRTMAETVRADADSQDAGVTYETALGDARKYRFFGPIGPSAYSSEERSIWIAIAASEAQVDVARLGLGLLEVPLVREIKSGLDDAALAPASTWRQAAFLVKSGASEPTGPAPLKRQYGLIRAIYRQWQRMKSGNAAAPLERNHAGNRDFDVNLDGLAHYGLLPDFLQDVSNQLRRGAGPVKDLQALFRSADAYVKTWERVEAAATARRAATSSAGTAASPTEAAPAKPAP